MTTTVFQSPQNGFLRVGSHLIDLGGHRIIGADEERKLTPKAVAVVVLLAQERGRTVGTDELLDRVWAGTCPTVDAVRQVIRELRRALDDPDTSSSAIETIARAGYRLVAECEFLDQTPGRSTVPVPETSVAAKPKPRSSVRSKWLVASAALVLATLVSVLVAVDRADVPEPARTADVEPAIEQAGEIVMITSAPSRDTQPRLSPDGTRVVYATMVNGGSTQIRVVGIDGTGDLVLNPPRQGAVAGPAWSPDGLHIAYYEWSEDHCRVVIMAALGGSERGHEACLAGAPGSLDWFVDGSALLLSQRSNPELEVVDLQRLDLQSGELTPFGVSDPYNTIDQMPRFSPDGRWLAVRRGSSPLSDLWLLPVADDGEPQRLTAYHAHMRGHGWSADGRGLVFSSNHSGQIALYWVDVGTLEIKALNIEEAMFPSLSPHGTLVFQRARYHVVLNELSEQASDQPEQSSEPLHASTGSEFNPVYSPDGRYLAFTSTRSGRWQIWVHDRESDELFALTRLRMGHIKVPSWSPDSRKLLIPIRDNESSLLYEADVAQRTMQIVWQDVRFLESAAYGDEGSFWLTIGDGGAVTLHRLRIIAGTQQLESKHVAATRLQSRPGDPAVYFREPRSGEVYRYDPEAGIRQRLDLPFKPWQWRLQDNSLHALSMTDQGRIDEWRYELSELKAHRLSPSLITTAMFPVATNVADRDPRSGRWVITAVAVTQDDIAATVVPKFMQATDRKGFMAISWP